MLRGVMTRIGSWIKPTSYDRCLMKSPKSYPCEVWVKVAFLCALCAKGDLIWEAVCKMEKSPFRFIHFEPSMTSSFLLGWCDSFLGTVGFSLDMIMIAWPAPLF